MHQSLSESFQLEEARIKDVYAERQDGSRYSWFNAAYIFLMQELEYALLQIFKRYAIAPLDTKVILDIGCGSGFWLREFMKWGAQPAHLTGVDLLVERVVRAKELCPSTMRIDCGNAVQLPFPDGTFDLVAQFTVFTSVLEARMKQRIATEMLRVVKPGGAILWYDYHVNNPWNPHVRGVPKREIIQLFPNCNISLKRISLAPPLARFFAPYSWLLCYSMSFLPFLCTHYIGIIQKK